MAEISIQTHYNQEKDLFGNARGGAKLAEEKGPTGKREERKNQRRKVPDRRELLRFEPEKEPRRKLKDRRKAGSSVWDDREDL